MEKLTSILATADSPTDIPMVLDKSVSIARLFGARIEFLVTDAESAHTVTAHCRQHNYDMVNLFSADGSQSFHEVILRRVFSATPDLVVKPPAGERSLRRFSFQESDWELANECPVPVLLVRGLAWSTPTRFAAAVDVADEDSAALARSILQTAGFLALGTHGNLDILYTEREFHDEALRMERAVKLAQLVREFHVGGERLQMFAGEPEKRLPPLVAARQYDVLILGGESRRSGLDQLVPGTVSRMMECTESDVVLVKAPATSLRIDSRRSVRQEGTNQRHEFA